MPDNPSKVAEPIARPDRADVWAGLPRPLTGTPACRGAGAHAQWRRCSAWCLSRWLPQPSVSLVYLVAVVLAAVGLGVRTGWRSHSSPFSPTTSFSSRRSSPSAIADPQELFALLVFLAVALLTGSLAGRMREVADDARQPRDRACNR